MAASVWQSRSFGPIILGAGLALLAAFPMRPAGSARAERVRVDPALDPRFLLESLDGMGGANAARIASARKEVAIDEPAALVAIPGVGARLLHLWHDELAFSGEAR
jgi:hypothetical protein